MSDPEGLCTGQVVQWYALRLYMMVDVDWPQGRFRGMIIERTFVEDKLMPVFTLLRDSEKGTVKETVEAGKYVTFHEVPVVVDAA